MQWLSVWLQETNFPYPGPKCQDGRLLRTSRIDKSLCTNFGDNNPRNGAAYSESQDLNHLPLLNEHGDIFQRELHDDYNEDCDAYEIPAAERPLPGESEYFYDQYVDYPPANETVASHTGHDNPSSSSHIESSNTVLNLHKKPTHTTPISSNIDLNNTILNTNYFKKKPGGTAYSSSSSPFTFFGYPIPSLSLGRFFGANQRGRKDRGDHTHDSSSRNRNISFSITSTSEMPATHRMHTGSGKVRMYQPNSAEFEKYLKDKDEAGEDFQYADASGRKRFTDVTSDETSASSENPSSVFKTAFRVPSSVERGGFKPIIPENNGGFMPVHDPTKRRGIVEVVASSSSKIDKRNRLNQLHETAANIYKHNKIAQTTTESTVTEEIEPNTYYVTESAIEQTTAYRPLLRNSINTTPNPVSPVTKSYNLTTTTTSSINTTTTTTTSVPDTTTKDTYEDLYEDDLEAQSVGMLKPPPLIQTTTSETILLIPPPEELVEQIKRHSWIHTTTAKQNSEEADNYLTTVITSSTSTTTTPKPFAYSTPTSVPLPYLPRPGGAARSTITKVYTPQTVNHHLPTAEEYQRTTPSVTAKSDETNDKSQLTANAQKRDEQIDRKDGMDWYYESFKKSRTSGSIKPIFSDSSSLRNSTSKQYPLTVYLVLITLSVISFCM